MRFMSILEAAIVAFSVIFVLVVGYLIAKNTEDTPSLIQQRNLITWITDKERLCYAMSGRVYFAPDGKHVTCYNKDSQVLWESAYERQL